MRESVLFLLHELTMKRWDVNCSVEEVMRGLHALVMAKQVLYLGASDMPAWVVVKANACECDHHPLIT